jgi:exonuclease III
VRLLQSNFVIFVDFVIFSNNLMKLISLNTWGGKLHDQLMAWIKVKAVDTDIFCFQEIFSTDTFPGFSSEAKMDLLQDLNAALPDHIMMFAPKSKGYDYSGYIGKDVHFGNAIFVPRALAISGYEDFFGVIDHPNYDWKSAALGKAQLIKFSVGEKQVNLCNFHGLWKNGTFKQDIPERFEQSQQLREWLDTKTGPQIICGDFNLLPSTESYKILQEGYRDLIAEYGVTSTRSSHYSKNVGYADYILTTPDIVIKDFKVLPDEVSDHLPLYLEFE